MPIQPTYPGVYIEEIPSGVRTITGVATSITAFVGTARRGPVNKASQILSFSDYERSFGGLDPNSDISYAISQFFLNGGTQAYIVRLARNAKRAFLTLGDDNKTPVLYIWALDEGTTGNDIRILIDQKDVIDQANFNITFSYTPLDNPTDAKRETFKNCSLDSQNPRYVVDLVHNVSTLVDVSQDQSVLIENVRDANAKPANSSVAVANASSSTALVHVGSSPVTGMGPTSGSFTSGAFEAYELIPLPNASWNSFKVGLDGDQPKPVTLESATPFKTGDLPTRLQDAATRIQTAVQGLSTTDAYKKFTCTFDASNKKLILSSGTKSASSQVNVASADTNDIAKALHLLDGTQAPGTAAVGTGTGTPPTPGTSGNLTSSAFEAYELIALPNASWNSFKIGLDVDQLTQVTLENTPFKTGDLPTRLQDAASRIQTAVQAINKSLPAYTNFTCTFDASNKKLILTSGTTGANSQVKVDSAVTKDIAKALHFDSASSPTTTPGTGGKLPKLLTVTGGSLISGSFGTNDLLPLPNSTSNSFKIGLDADNATTHTVTFDQGTPFAGKDLASRLQDAATRIQTAVRELSASATDGYKNFTCTLDSTKTKLILSSGTTGASSQVNVASADTNDIAKVLHLLDGTSTPGTAVSGSGTPPTPATSGSLTSSAFVGSDLPPLPYEGANSFKISLDGDPPKPITLENTPFKTGDLPTRLQDAAQRIQQKVRRLNPAAPAYRDFTCVLDSQTNPTKLVLTSGTTDPKSSSVVVTQDDQNDIAKALHLLDGENRLADIPALQDGGGELFGENDSDYPSIYLGVEDPLQMSGIYALEKIDLFNLLCLPGVKDAGILTAALQYCKQRRAVLIVDAPQNLKQPNEILDRIKGTTTVPSPLPKADLGTYAAIYYPWVQLPDPLKGGRLRSFPPSGIIAGLCARTDTARGVWKAPAGIDANLIGVQGLDYTMTDDENGTLNPHGINCLRAFPVYGIVCWGARTVSGDDQIASEYKYIPIRRLALYIEESLYRGTKWVVFEPNDEPLWAQIRLNVGAFMHNLFRKGAFQGQTPKEAYFVKCDKETTTQNDRDLGIVNIVVGFAPLKPAEFVIIQLQQIAGDIQV